MLLSELKPKEMAFSSSGKKMREILTTIVGSISSGLKTLACFVFSACRKVTKVATDA